MAYFGRLVTPDRKFVQNRHTLPPKPFLNRVIGPLSNTRGGGCSAADPCRLAQFPDLVHFRDKEVVVTVYNESGLLFYLRHTNFVYYDCFFLA